MSVSGRHALLAMCYALVSVLLRAPFVAGQAPQPGDPVAQVTSPATPGAAAQRRAVVHVSVIDSSGAPVRDLTAGDFTLTIDDTPRHVTASTPGRGAPPAEEREEDAAEEGASNRTGARPRLLVLVLDEGQIRPDATKAFVGAAGRLLDVLAPADLVAVVRLPRLTDGTDFTADRETLRASLERTVGRAAPFAAQSSGITLGAASEFLRGIGQLHDELTTRVCGGTRSGGTSGGGPAGGGFSGERCTTGLQADAQALVDDLTLRTKDTAFGLEHVMERLAPVPGPKDVVLLSEALFLGANSKVLARAATLATRASASISVLQPEDLPKDAVATLPFSATDPTRELLRRGLEQIATATGGTFAVTGSDGRGAARLADVFSAVYGLSFTPEPGDLDGRPHVLSVHVGRPGTTVRAHPEWVAPAALNPGAVDERLRALLASPAFDDTVPLRAIALLSPVAGGRVRTFVQVSLDADHAGAPNASAAAIVLDRSGAVVSSFSLEPAMLHDADPRRGLVLGGARDVEPGEYRLRVAAVLPDGRAGSLETPLIAKPRQAGEVSYSDLLVGLRPPPGQAFRPVPVPIVDHELLMAVELASADADTTSGAEVHFEIAETPDGESIVNQQVEVPPGKKVATAAAAIDLSLAPGAYVARARLTVPGVDPVVLSRSFRVIGGAADRVGTPRIDRSQGPAPTVAPFDRARVLASDALSPFLDHLARTFPPGRSGTDLLAKARTGQFDVPHTVPASGPDAVASSFVRGLAALRDTPGQPCVTAFNDAIERAGGFIGFALFQGDCYAASGHDRDAIAAWEMALLGDVGLPVIYEQLVDGLLRLGDGERALATLADADLVWLDRRGFDRRRGLALALLDRNREALPLLEAAAGDPAADTELLFFVLRGMHVGRVAGWLESTPETRARFQQYLDRYVARKGSYASIARGWRKEFGE